MTEQAIACVYAEKASRSRRLEISRDVKRLGFRAEPTLSVLTQRPKVEVRQDGRLLIIAIDVHGLADLRVVLEEGPPAILLIDAKKDFDAIEQQYNVKIAAKGSSKFNATLLLPPEVDQRSLAACFEGSLLMLVGEKRTPI